MIFLRVCTRRLLESGRLLNHLRMVCYICVFLDTSVGEIEETFKTFTSRGDIAIILINQIVSISHSEVDEWTGDEC